ncbi:hypothetical protein [Jatrophihabitans sp.]|uniref:hypothetical protein n=1 Tax=Jatrophihabitans sp. TaxID=1932789 RepID=UPI0030C755C0|nr:hypothetical protein [Jatrophihabitans sp.]
MTGPLADTWHTRDLVVLQAVVTALDGSLQGIDPAELIDPTGMTEDQVTAALIALKRGQYIEMASALMLSGDAFHSVNGVTEKAYRATGAWPSNETMTDRLLAALTDIAEYGDDPLEKSRARKALDALGGFSRDTLVSVVGAAAGVAMQ